MKTRHTDISVDEDSRDSINVSGNERRVSTRSSSRALTSAPRVMVRKRVHDINELERYINPRLVTRRSKRKKYSSYPDIEYAAAKRTKQSSGNSCEQKIQDESGASASARSPRLPEQLVTRRSRHSDDGGSPPSPSSPARRRARPDVGSPRHQARLHERQGRRLPKALKRLKSDLGDEYEEDMMRSYNTSKPYGLRRERQIVSRYEAPDFREVTRIITSDDEDDDEEDDDDEVEEEEGDEREDEDLDDSRTTRKYSLRRKPPKVVRYADNSLSEPKRRGMYQRSYSPNREYRRQYATGRRGRVARRVVRSHVQGRRPRRQSSTSESDTEKDEAHFEKRKKKSMQQARSKCLPMNLAVEDIQKGLFKERLKAGASMADIDPMSLDRTTDFTSIGGLDEHIKSLREMVVFPMLYPEVFHKFDIAPPRGVIFYGSPGTGKTLVARALSNECSKEGQKISFFMRKGADCLSKWVGESERQLRLLFDQAYSMRPSIIFFDEIDGLAPVRSTRQEQIHSSIVSTLLALMDGLDSRGEIVVIGATNRLDAIDPALRRPGRFDREFHFPLPSVKARSEILRIHTSKWSPAPHADLLAVLAERTAGFCGADLKALVTESALSALRRRYPQIYGSKKRLLLDPDCISVRAQDFYQALARIEPAQSRSNERSGEPLPAHIRPLLSDTVNRLVEKAVEYVPSLVSSPSTGLVQHRALGSNSRAGRAGDGRSDLVLAGEPDIYSTGRGASSYTDISNYFSNLEQYFSAVPCHRPRILVTSHNKLVMSSFLHELEGVVVHEVSLTTLHDPNYHTVEEAVSRIVRSSCKTTPSILYIPHLDVLESSCNISVCNVLYTLVSDFPPQSGVLVVATTTATLDQGSMFSDLFRAVDTVSLLHPTPLSVYQFFSPLLHHDIRRNTLTVTAEELVEEEELQEAPPVTPKPLTNEEVAAIEKREESTLRELRLFLRDIVNKLMKERKFYCFCKPVNLDEVHDYLEVVEKPMDLETIRENIDVLEYETIKSFVDDVELISANALEYNPAEDHTGRQIRHRAAELRDYLHSLLDAELDEDFAALCEEMKKARESRRSSGVTDNCTTNAPERKAAAVTRDDSTQRGNHVETEQQSCTSPPVENHLAEEEQLIEGVLKRIVEVVKHQSVDEMIRLHTLISQLIVKNRTERVTVSKLLNDQIVPVIESFDITAE